MPKIADLPLNPDILGNENLLVERDGVAGLLPAHLIGRGERGEDALYVGGFDRAHQLAIPHDIRLVQTSNFDDARPNKGGGTFIADDDVDDAFVASHPRACFKDRNGRRFRLKETGGIWVEAFGAVGDGVTDDTAAIQAANDYLFTFRGKGASAAAITTPPLLLDAKVYAVHGRLTKTIHSWLGCGSDNTRLVWNGPADQDFIRQDSVVGANSAGRIQGLTLAEGASKFRDAIFIPRNTTASAFGVDDRFHISDVRIRGGWRDQISIDRWVNLNLRDMRFDSWGRYAIVLKSGANQFLSSFSCSNFTIDHMEGTHALGFAWIDNSDGATNVGGVKFENGRVESNSNYADADATRFPTMKAWFRITSVTSHTVSLILDNIALQDVIGTGNDYLVFRDSVADGAPVLGSEKLTLRNVDLAGLSGVFMGDLYTDHPTVPVGNYLSLTLSGQGGVAHRVNSSGQDNIEVFTRPAENKSAIRIYHGAEEGPRINMTGEGNVEIFDGIKPKARITLRSSDGVIVVNDGTSPNARAIIRHDGLYLGNGTVSAAKIIGPRKDGWTAWTGAASRAGKATYLASPPVNYTAGSPLSFGAAYVKSEHDTLAARVAAIEVALATLAAQSGPHNTALQDLSQGFKALTDDLSPRGGNHALI